MAEISFASHDVRIMSKPLISSCDVMSFPYPIEKKNFLKIYTSFRYQKKKVLKTLKEREIAVAMPQEHIYNPEIACLVNIIVNISHKNQKSLKNVDMIIQNFSE